MSKNKKKVWADFDVEDWGSYMAAKKAKLEEQFDEEAEKEFKDATSLFSGVAIFVNGYTNPCADELKRLMMANGGIYHHYLRSRVTTHIIASNLPYSKIVAYRKSQNPLPIIKPEWITDSLKEQKLLDWRPYLLYSNCSKTQPALQFAGKSSASVLFAATVKGNETSISDVSAATLKSNETSISNAPVATVNKTSISNVPENSINNSAAPKAQSTTAPVTTNSKESSPSKHKTHSGPLCTKNAEFLSEFYNNSRLHHISTMGATFKDYVNELRTKNDGKFAGLERLKALSRSAIRRPPVQNESDSEEDLFDSPASPEPVKVEEGPVIMHIDMDCFFVSVGLRSRPELKGLPVAVTHAKGNKQTSSKNGESDNEEDYGSMSEVASCSYEARKAGVKNGMFLGQALKLCPNLKTIKYDFEGYKEVSYTLYNTVASYTLSIEAVSCDEMYADVTTALNKTELTPLQFASFIREEIKEKTGCPVSTGFGCNKLQARLATKKAKPDGQFYLENANVQEYIGSMIVRDLPGVGYSTTRLLNKMNIHNCADLQNVSLGTLQKEFGKKTGEMLHNMCRGIDNSKLNLEHVRKSVSAEVNYGIRFENGTDADVFLRQLSQEVCSRLQKANAKGRSVTLKLMVRAKDAPKEAMKFMGHGVCDHFSKSKNLVAPVDDVAIITKEVLSLWHQMQQSPEDIRGIGIQISRLESLKTRIGSGNLMSFINKAKHTDSETVSTGSANSSKESTELNVNSIKPGFSGNDKMSAKKNVEVPEPKPRGLKAFFVSKERVPPNRNGSNRVDNASSKTDVEEIDESVLAQLPADIRMEILKSRGDDRVYTCADPKPSTSAAPDIVSDDHSAASSHKIEEKNSPPRVDPAAAEVPSIQDIDESVLKELPEDIRNEILGVKNTVNLPSRKTQEQPSSKTRQTQQETYFKHTKSNSGKSSKASMPPIETIDMSVLIELPEDIRNEIINEYKANKQAREQSNNVKNNEIIENSEAAPTERLHNDRSNGKNFVEDESNMSFSQIDPEFLAALSEDMKKDVQMYCIAKKKEKIKKISDTNAASLKPPAKSKTQQKLNKKNSRLPKSKNKFVTSTKGSSNEQRNTKRSPELARKNEIAEASESSKRPNKDNRTSGRFLTSEFVINQEANESLKQREEIITHHSSFIGNQAKSHEQEMMTNLVNYLFTLPVRQVKMQIQTWISNSDVVNEIDLLSLATFLSMLPKKKRLEDLHILLKTMHRCITKTGSCVWHETYRRTVIHVQRYMQIEYKSNLMLPRIECDLCECKSNH